MNKSADLSEGNLSQQIFDLFQEKRIEILKSTPLAKPTGNATKIIPQHLYNDILEFFKNVVGPFIKSLEDYSNQLNNTVNFDLHKIFEGVKSGSVRIAESGDVLLEKVPKSTVKMIKEMFRYVVWPWIKNSYFVSRGLLKPKGYPGDYVIVEGMYDGNAKSLGLGYVYDVIFLQTQLCQGLRNRKDQMKQIMINYFKLEASDKGKVTIFNIGCGGSRDLREVVFPNEGDKIKIYLMDFDQEAIDFSVNNLQPKVPKAEIIPLSMDVRELITEEGVNKNKIDQCNLIYSIGLFDYLPDRIIIKLLKNMLLKLKESGLLVFAHKDYKLYNPRIADWFCDWKYYSRTQEDFEKMFNELGVNAQELSFSREKDGYIFFAQVRKPLENREK